MTIAIRELSFRKVGLSRQWWQEHLLALFSCLFSFTCLLSCLSQSYSSPSLELSAFPSFVLGSTEAAGTVTTTVFSYTQQGATSAFVIPVLQDKANACYKYSRIKILVWMSSIVCSSRIVLLLG